MQNLIWNSYSADNFNPYFNGVASAIANKTLTQGYYYMEIVSVNYEGSGDFRMMVDMPKIHNYTANPTWQVDEIVILPEAITPEVLEIKVNKTAIGTNTSFTISYYESSTIIYTATIPWGATADRFRS